MSKWAVVSKCLPRCRDDAGGQAADAGLGWSMFVTRLDRIPDDLSCVVLACSSVLLPNKLSSEGQGPPVRPCPAITTSCQVTSVSPIA